MRLLWQLLFCSRARRENRRIASYVTVFAKLPLLLTPLTYIHVGKAAIGKKSASAYQQMWPREVYINFAGFFYL
ncbi:hypothetical protein EQU24_11165 [Methylotuvimicrobium buryatense]|uniref:Uncharacterized protein n=1 Tax=Methylotuvimicrobium buryatense TaxID=95641 RepID=A0A4V1IJV6_METBY|nr:hypothetical protein EQU24_11165 [Methylotuvimicrobium buryatense]